MSVQTEINRINGEVSSQATKLAELKTILQGKASGGGGGSGSTPLQRCSVSIDNPYITDYVLYTDNYGDLCAANPVAESSLLEIPDVAVGSDLCVIGYGEIDGGITCNNAELIDELHSYHYIYCYILRIDGNATIAFE